MTYHRMSQLCSTLCGLYAALAACPPVHTKGRANRERRWRLIRLIEQINERLLCTAIYATIETIGAPK